MSYDKLKPLYYSNPTCFITAIAQTSVLQSTLIFFFSWIYHWDFQCLGRGAEVIVLQKKRMLQKVIIRNEEMMSNGLRQHY